MKQITVRQAADSYDIVLNPGLMTHIGQMLKEAYPKKKFFFLTDKHVAAYYEENLCRQLSEAELDFCIFAVDPGEQSKSLETLQQVYTAMADFCLTRTDLLIVLGGGIPGDLGGFAASTYLRGIPLLHLPSSLMAQVDSSVGGKNAVNLTHGKNLIGSFYAPEAVWTDVQLLSTLPDTNFREGLAEIIKYGCICDSQILQLLERHTLSSLRKEEALCQDLVSRCCELKSWLVYKDPFDMGERMLLNFGHTLGHAIEGAGAYRHTHGQAVAIGMAETTKLSEAKGLTKPGSTEYLHRLLSNYGLPVHLDQLNIDENKIKAFLMHDKKRRQNDITLAIFSQLGQGRLLKTDLSFFDEVFHE